MKALSFNLSGKFAHFKKPDVNSYAYFTYSHIHKIALLGIIGAILGLEGYKRDLKDYPEFYEKLKDFKISIIPKKPYFSKKMIYFNNSVGYASREEGGNLIVREQWLEKPQWEILILENETEEFKELKNRLFKKEFAFIPYLGKNDHFAKIENIKEIEFKRGEKDLVCVSLIPKNKAVLKKHPRFGEQFFYSEFLPVALKKKFLIYEYEEMILSSWIVECKDENYFEYNNENLYFI
ncbi:CRISPR-associated protein Cas5h [Lebetimonas natsushimae]|uniref:CRISPR-associated protein Cas5h n=1 Tax=Lebetimonas natsushimae TaxID=1936991 RepID=A0A292YGI8_9BACT|nr:type I-B CRISPR-associated protein Cas5b [Lebetimonas natsushimae]GAX88010.1 CRISPR-associated protein Cas5h [Lebetimonas natsushimae]